MRFAPQRHALCRHMNSKIGPNPAVFYTFDLEMCFTPQQCTLFQHLNFQKRSETISFDLKTCFAPQCTFLISQLRKVLRASQFFTLLTWKCASRHNGVHFFDLSTSKSGPNLVCFVHFDLEMCFAPQRRAIFHLSSGQLAPHPPL